MGKFFRETKRRRALFEKEFKAALLGGREEKKYFMAMGFLAMYWEYKVVKCQ